MGAKTVTKSIPAARFSSPDIENTDDFAMISSSKILLDNKMKAFALHCTERSVYSATVCFIRDSPQQQYQGTQLCKRYVLTSHIIDNIIGTVILQNASSHEAIPLPLKRKEAWINPYSYECVLFQLSGTMIPYDLAHLIAWWRWCFRHWWRQPQYQQSRSIHGFLSTTTCREGNLIIFSPLDFSLHHNDPFSLFFLFFLSEY